MTIPINMAPVLSNPKPNKIQTKTLSTFLTEPIPEIEYYLKPIIPKSSIIYCFGPPGSFKTNFLLYSALCLADGKKVFEYTTENKCKILWIDEENRNIGMASKVKSMINGMEFSSNSFDNIELSISNHFDILNDTEDLKEIIIEKKINIVVIDSIAKVFPLNERDEKDVRKIYSFLSPIVEELNTTFILIHHTRKGSKGAFISRNMEDISGSREFSAMADGMILIEKNLFKNQNPIPGQYTLTQVKARYGMETPKISFSVSGDDKKMNIEYNGTITEIVEEKTNECEVAFEEWINRTGKEEFKTSEITQELKPFFSEKTIKRMLNKKIKDRSIIRSKKGNYSLPAFLGERTGHTGLTLEIDESDDDAGT